MEKLGRRKLNPHLGVEIECSGLDLTKPLSKEGARSLFESVVEHKVVALRSTGLRTPEAHRDLIRQLQAASLEGTACEKPDELLYEAPTGRRSLLAIENNYALKEVPAVLHIGPFPTKGSHKIGNAIWHSDAEFFHHASWFSSLRMTRLPRDPETKEVLPCGDTMWADVAVAFEDLPQEEKDEYLGMKVIGFGVAYPHLRRKAEQGTPGVPERFQELTQLFPPIERPLVRRHPVNGRPVLKIDAGYASHIVGASPERSEEILQRVMRLCEVPEYQLRLSWHSEDDLVVHDNYQVSHRVVADFSHLPAESRLVENIGTKGYPHASNVLIPWAWVNDERNFAPGSVGRKGEDKRLGTANTSKL